MSTGEYNTRSAGVKRLMKEAQELREPTDMYFAQPLEDNLFEWHFTVRGPADTDFADGLYHGRIILPPEYPMKPPSVILLTPNGRFELNKRICLSISGFHPESWQPSWSIRTALLAIIGFFPTHSAGAIGGLEYPPEERRKLAKTSAQWVCDVCGARMRDVLVSAGNVSATQLARDLRDRELAAQITVSEKKSGEDDEDKTPVELPTEEIDATNEEVPRVPVATTTAIAGRGRAATDSGQLVLIFLLSVVFAALFFRRLTIFME